MKKTKKTKSKRDIMKWCTEYQYKCRMCGEIFSPQNSFGYRWMSAMSEVMGAMDRTTEGAHCAGMLALHASCGGKKKRRTQFGVGDFIGAKRELFWKPTKK